MKRNSLVVLIISMQFFAFPALHAGPIQYAQSYLASYIINSPTQILSGLKPLLTGCTMLGTPLFVYNAAVAFRSLARGMYYTDISYPLSPSGRQELLKLVTNSAAGYAGHTEISRLSSSFAGHHFSAPNAVR